MFMSLLFKILLSVWLFLGFFSKFHSDSEYLQVNQNLQVSEFHLIEVSDVHDTLFNPTHTHGCHFGHGGCLFNFTRNYFGNFNHNFLTVVGLKSNSFYTAPEQKVFERPPIS